jgi:hypothetical protein
LSNRNSATPRARSTAGSKFGYGVSIAVALLLLGTVVLIAKQLPESSSNSTVSNMPTTNGAAPKDPAYTQRARSSAY